VLVRLVGIGQGIGQLLAHSMPDCLCTRAPVHRPPACPPQNALTDIKAWKIKYHHTYNGRVVKVRSERKEALAPPQAGNCYLVSRTDEGRTQLLHQPTTSLSLP